MDFPAAALEAAEAAVGKKKLSSFAEESPQSSAGLIAAGYLQSSRSASSEEERQHEQNQKYEENHLSYARRGASYEPESEDSRYQGDYQEH